MTRDDIIRMTREAGFHEPMLDDGFIGQAYIDITGRERGGNIMLFAELVAAAEREACATLVEPMGDWCGGHGEPRCPTPRECAKAIRARNPYI